MLPDRQNSTELEARHRLVARLVAKIPVNLITGAEYLKPVTRNVVLIKIDEFLLDGLVTSRYNEML